MGAGIVVRAAGSRLPSEHFADHFPLTSAPLRAFAAGLIDGQAVSLPDPPVDVIPHLGDGRFAQFGVVDTSVGADRAFVIMFLARTPAELATTPRARDPRGTPTLLDDFHHGSIWEAYNAHLVDFQVYPRELIYGGTWPRV